jgi:hypothetical protein
MGEDDEFYVCGGVQRLAGRVVGFDIDMGQDAVAAMWAGLES